MLGKWLPNILRVLNSLSKMGLLASERRDRMRVYKVRSSKREFAKYIIEQATLHAPSVQTSPITQSFWADALHSALRQVLPPQWSITVDEEIHSVGNSVTVDLLLRSENGLNFGIELNVGSPRQHLYSTIGKVVGFNADELALLILVLLIPRQENDPYWNRISQRRESGMTQFAVVLRTIPESEDVFGREAAKKIMQFIKDYLQTRG